MTSITAETILAAYRIGIFPMADSADDPSLFWVDPDRRGIFPLDKFHVPKRLTKSIRKDPFEVTIDLDFRGVMRACAAPRRDGGDTWINPEIMERYSELHDLGYAHSVECRRDGELVGGLYGLAQFLNPHLETFGAEEISREEYQARLRLGLQSLGDFYSLPEGLSGSDILQSITQTS